ncbi:hypothetical protein SAMN05518672_1011690 [Chitinophaga sp. CF118]|uniref:hypothetical protein n=1 Tax=Chitinophaga sp. CF118 TaxID=1884367 RepID=UPI0008F132A4|nr:hypothetical protein [Chitinophaga sp. CF118]SFD33623.1 hypothetical protein SAMN05518672_1011690 [Chitinophaga sp. CF118]
MVRTLLTSFLLIACCTAGYSQKGLYTPAQEWPVKINDGWFTAKTITYGPYTTTDRKNGIADAAAVSFIKDPQAPFNFIVTGQDERILVQELRALHVAFSSRSLPSFLDNMPSTAPFSYVQINGTKNDPLKRWELILKEATYLELNENKPLGTLRSDQDEIRITAHNDFGTKNSYENICYEFHYRRKDIAAVIPGEKPRIWMSTEIPVTLQPVLAATIGALLLR